MTRENFRLAVLNPGGNDGEQHFADGAGAPDDAVHAPVNYHAYAACTSGAFYQNPGAIRAGNLAVLLLIRHDVRACLIALKKLKTAGKIVAVSLKESGAHQVAALFAEARRMEFFGEICARADAALSSTSELVPVYRGAGARSVKFIPTPYPVDDPRWDFSVPVTERRGVFIGTREFAVPSRHHLAALLAAKAFGEPITVFNVEGRAGRQNISALEIPCCTVLEKRLAYSEYLRVLARHKIVFQLDRSSVPGQVAGDALLCRVPCVGGDGAVERIAFPETNGHGRDAGELVESATQLLADGAAYQDAVERSQRIARESLSFPFIAAGLADFFQRLEGV